ncbi:MAG: PAS domain-containing protein, partial [Deltaproteobacteria bacterium]|nr:PAS domain-containing protein [Deltaproteobacteria bacterium]
MGQIKALSVAIVGGGAGCKAIMDMIFAEKLRQLQMKLVGVACTNPQAVGYCYAQEKGIYTTRDYRDLYKLKDLNMIIELTGREEVANEISRTKPDHIRLMDHVAARVFWDVFQIEEERLAECKRAEQAIELVYAELDQIFETAAGGMCVIDKDFNVLRINQTFLTLLGLSKGEAVGKKCHEVLRGPLCHTPECTLTQILGGKERVECEVEKERKDGTRISCIVTATSLRGPDGKLIGIVEDFRDITKRLRAEKELREQQNLFKTILAATPDFLVLKDRDSVYQAVNPAFCQFIGKKEKEIIGKTDLDLFPRSEAEMYRRDDARVMETRTPQVQDEEVTGTKGKRWLQVAKTPVLDETGKAVGILCSIRDISDRKRAEAEKQKLQTQFQQAQKLEAIGTLAGGIAHDFNNLLMGIQGNVSLMAMDIDPTHPHYERLKNIEKQIQSGARLTSHLLGYARKGRYELKPIDLNQLVEESSETFGRTNKGITIHQKLARDLFPIEADPGQIEQVLLNL